MLSKINSVLQWVIIIGLAIVLLFMKCDRDRARSELADLRKDVQRQAMVDMPENAVTWLQMRDYVAKEVVRVSLDSVIVREVYIPPESDVEYIVRTDTVAMGRLIQVGRELDALREAMRSGELTRSDSLRLDSLESLYAQLESQIVQPELKFDSYGFCWKPQIGFGRTTVATNEVTIGGRLWYWNRIGIQAHLALDLPKKESGECGFGAGMGVDWRIPSIDNVALRLSLEYDTVREKLRGSLGVSFFLN